MGKKEACLNRFISAGAVPCLVLVVPAIHCTCSTLNVSSMTCLPNIKSYGTGNKSNAQPDQLSTNHSKSFSSRTRTSLVATHTTSSTPRVFPSKVPKSSLLHVNAPPQAVYECRTSTHSWMFVHSIFIGELSKQVFCSAPRAPMVLTPAALQEFIPSQLLLDFGALHPSSDRSDERNRKLVYEL